MAQESKFTSYVISATLVLLATGIGGALIAWNNITSGIVEIKSSKVDNATYYRAHNELENENVKDHAAIEQRISIMENSVMDIKATIMEIKGDTKEIKSKLDKLSCADFKDGSLRLTMTQE